MAFYESISEGYGFPMSIIWIWSTGLAFAIHHSVFSTQYCKAIFNRIGLTNRTYRLIYTIVAIALAALWLGFVHQLPDTPLYHLHGWVNGLLMVIRLMGLGIVVLSLRAIDTSAFLGLSVHAGGQDAFTERGIYRHVRHPMYVGVMLALLASPVQTVNSLNLFAVIAVYFIVGSKLEEKRMLAMHPEYADYKHRVPAFIPRPMSLSSNE